MAGQIGTRRDYFANIEPGTEVVALPKTSYGLIIVYVVNSGKTSILVANSQSLTESSFISNDADLSTTLDASGSLCINRRSTNGELVIQNNTSGTKAFYVKCVIP